MLPRTRGSCGSTWSTRFEGCRVPGSHPVEIDVNETLGPSHVIGTCLPHFASNLVTSGAKSSPPLLLTIAVSSVQWWLIIKNYYMGVSINGLNGGTSSSHPIVHEIVTIQRAWGYPISFHPWAAERRPSDHCSARTMIAIPGTTKIPNAEANFAAWIVGEYQGS